MSAVGDRFVSDGVECEVVWSGGPLLPVFHKPGANCSLGNWYQHRRAARSVEPRADRPGAVDTRSYKRSLSTPVRG
jgi:hypothetical protein